MLAARGVVSLGGDSPLRPAAAAALPRVPTDDGALPVVLLCVEPERSDEGPVPASSAQPTAVPPSHADPTM
jgi:hypothetical protein